MKQAKFGHGVRLSTNNFGSTINHQLSNKDGETSDQKPGIKYDPKFKDPSKL